MKVRIKTKDSKTLSYETKKACWFDFKAHEDIEIKPWEFKLVDTWTVIETPDWYALQIQPRSSTFKNYWLIQTNWVWLVDQDYSWDNDFIKFPYFNISNKTAIIKKWDRIWQWVFIKIWIASFDLTDSMWNSNRWWFWSTWI